MNTKNKKIRAKSQIRKVIGRISFADVLLSYRKSQELSQVKMAEVLGISKQDLCNIEKGRKVVSVDRAIGFAESLGRSPKIFAKYVLQGQLVKAGLKAEVDIREVA